MNIYAYGVKVYTRVIHLVHITRQNKRIFSEKDALHYMKLLESDGDTNATNAFASCNDAAECNAICNELI